MIERSAESIRVAIHVAEEEIVALRAAIAMQANASSAPFLSRTQGHPHPAMIRLEQTLASLRHDLSRSEGS